MPDLSQRRCAPRTRLIDEAPTGTVVHETLTGRFLFIDLVAHHIRTVALPRPASPCIAQAE
jgi:hypothetical protein